GWEAGKTGSTNAMNAHDYQNYFAAAGNVLGTDGYSTSYSGNTAAIWNYSSTSSATLSRRGNYNYANRAVPSNESLNGDTINISYRYSSKPSWFGGLPWPPVDPANPAAAVLTNLPAGYRYQNNANPPLGASGVAPPTNLRLL